MTSQFNLNEWNEHENDKMMGDNEQKLWWISNLINRFWKLSLILHYTYLPTFIDDLNLNLSMILYIFKMEVPINVNFTNLKNSQTHNPLLLRNCHFQIRYFQFLFSFLKYYIANLEAFKLFIIKGTFHKFLLQWFIQILNIYQYVLNLPE